MHPEVADKMYPFFMEVFGNPSSIHFYGRQSRHEVDDARAFIAKSIHAKQNEIIFTSGGTEADNLAIIGAALAQSNKGKHIITTEIEHHAVLHTCQYLEKQGFQITYLRVDQHGVVSIEELKKALTDETILVSIMLGNNEVGVIQPIAQIGAILANHQAYFHTDAVQAYGILPIDVKVLGVDLLSISAHKLNGPKGIGFLYAKEGIRLTPHLFGGEQERKRRAGTENVPGIVGLKSAVEISQQSMDERQLLYKQFKEMFISILKEQEIEYSVNGNLKNSLPHVLNISFNGMNVESMLVNLDLAGIAVSSGSACTAGSIDPSHVLVAMFGKESERVKNSLRFSFGLGNTMKQIERAAHETAKIVKRVRN